MDKAAIPKYLGTDFKDCPPGHRFTLYGAFWKQDWQRVEKIEPQKHLKPFNQFPSVSKETREALLERQSHLSATLGDKVLTIEAESIAPFVTGTGIDHPLENGMAFLNPYGLPYLPGSSVKGVVRRAAQELAGIAPGVTCDDSYDWTENAVVLLFGKQPPPGVDDASRGALTFWDVLPRCSGLSVDIMNPHYGKYYEGSEPPHDAGIPKPIYFLTLPPKSSFAFHVQCDLHRLRCADELTGQWQTLLKAALDHAFEWLGFGAKTTVGYGAMKRASEVKKKNTGATKTPRPRSGHGLKKNVADVRPKAQRRKKEHAELEALPEDRKLMISAERMLKALRENNYLDEEQRNNAKNIANQLAEATPAWPDPDKREKAAKLSEEIYDNIGWHEPKSTPKQRKRQEKKKRDAIARIRHGN